VNPTCPSVQDECRKLSTSNACESEGKLENTRKLQATLNSFMKSTPHKTSGINPEPTNGMPNGSRPKMPQLSSSSSKTSMLRVFRKNSHKKKHPKSKGCPLSGWERGNWLLLQVCDGRYCLGSTRRHTSLGNLVSRSFISRTPVAQLNVASDALGSPLA